MAVTHDGVETHELTPEEARAIFEKVANEYLGISGQEFIRRWDAGEFDGDERYEVQRVSFLLPLAH